MQGETCIAWLMDAVNAFFIYGVSLTVQSTILVMAGLAAVWVVRNKPVFFRNFVLKGILVAAILAPLCGFAVHSAGFRGIVFEVEPAVIATGGTAGAVATAVYPSARMDAAQADSKQARYSAPDSGKHGMATGLPLALDLRYRFSHTKAYGALVLIGENGRAVSYIAFAALWVSMSLFFAIRLFVSFVRMRRLRRSCRDARPEHIALNTRIARHLQVDPPLLLEHEDVESPFMLGVVRPAIIIPEGFGVTGEMLVHEQTHMIRHDCAWNLFGELTRILLPLQPLTAVLVRAIQETGDYICDEYVVRYNNDSHSYATQLYELAVHMDSAEPVARFSVGYFFGKPLKRRIEHILSCTGAIVQPGPGFVAALTVVTFLSAFAVGQIRFRDAFPTDGSYSATEAVVTGVEPPLTVGFAGSTTDFGNGISALPSANTSSRQDANPPPTTAVAHADDSSDSANDTEEKSPDTALSSALVSATASASASGVTESDMLPVSVQEPVHILQQEVTESRDPSPAWDMPVNEGMDKPDTVVEAVDAVMEPKILTASVIESNDEPSIDPRGIPDIKTCKAIAEDYLALGRWVDAEKVLYRAMELDSQDPEIRNTLGLVYEKKREPDLALLYFKLAVSIKPDFAGAYYNIGRILQSMGKPDAAWDNYKIAININPALARDKGVYRALD